ncbi:DEKNAAC102078 [Brettanomyces naardenensis]|uniref:DEKNAAC102078 n=1 Tax=Brettanomyces naardenensis TaxID=13370 RepID=A0A448YJU6_BRENA|nr:DEKNAAC102078 [Brettanomyces naardenensis]
MSAHSSSSSLIPSYTPEQSIPIVRRQSRRKSFLDYGGENSINNFASSVKRSVDFLSSSLGSATTPSENDLITRTLSEDVPGSYATSFTERSPLLIDTTTSTPPINEEEAVESSPFKDNASSIAVEAGQPSLIVNIAKKSTPMQTIFNSINVLIGLGILSVPLALHLSGWIPGMICLLLAALSTRYTAVLLGRILAKVHSLNTYQDIAVHVYGRSIGYFILATFSLDLYGAGVSMVIIFSDSFNALIPSLSPFVLKAILCTILMVLNLLPLRFLSVLSLVGIFCTTCTFFIILASGLWKSTQPGSLLHSMPTNLFPSSFIDFCFSLGLFLAPWGGHATFPEIYSDQKKPGKFSACMDISFSFCYAVDALTGIIGFLMFGRLTDSEVTRNILLTPGYSTSVKTTIVTLMGLLPISKLPLVCRPITTAADNFHHPQRDGKCPLYKKIINRFLISFVYFFSALFITSFGKVMSLLGSAICFTVCITLPVLFYLNVFRDELGRGHKLFLYVLAVVSVLCAIFGSVSVLLK